MLLSRFLKYHNPFFLLSALRGYGIQPTLSATLEGYGDLTVDDNIYRYYGTGETDAEANFQKAKRSIREYNQTHPGFSLFDHNVDSTMSLFSSPQPQTKEIFKELSSTIAQFIFDRSRTYADYDESFNHFNNALLEEMGKLIVGEVDPIISLLKIDPEEAGEKFMAMKENLEPYIENIRERRYPVRGISVSSMIWFTIGILIHLADTPEEVIRVFGDDTRATGFMRYLSDIENKFVEKRFSDDLEARDLIEADMKDLRQPERKRRRRRKN